MKIQFISRVLIGAIAILLSISPAQANDMLFFDGFGMFASKSTLMIETGNYQGRFAMTIHFGYGLSAKSIGVVYKEGLEEQDGEKIVAAMEKLSKILNDPKTTALFIQKDLSKDIGLTFDTFVKQSEIK